jgi:hypothetical protein
MSDSNKTSRRLQREVLPIPDQPYAGLMAYDAKDPDSKFPPIEELRPPQGAPNVGFFAGLCKKPLIGPGECDLDGVVEVSEGAL